MIRGILASTLPILGLGLVAAFAGPDLVTGPRGTPIVIGAEKTDFQPASFSGEACASHLLFGKGQRLDGETRDMQVVALALRPDGQTFEVAIRDVPARSDAEKGTVVLLLDEFGRPVAASREPTVSAPTIFTHAGCVKAPRPSWQKRV